MFTTKGTKLTKGRPEAQAAFHGKDRDAKRAKTNPQDHPAFARLAPFVVKEMPVGFTGHPPRYVAFSCGSARSCLLSPCMTMRPVSRT